MSACPDTIKGTGTKIKVYQSFYHHGINAYGEMEVNLRVFFNIR
jgi:hypothetical protein